MLNGFLPQPPTPIDRSISGYVRLAPFHAVSAKSRFAGKSGRIRSEHKWRFKFNRLPAIRWVDMDLLWLAI
jgi:hypothetical protein